MMQTCSIMRHIWQPPSRVSFRCQAILATRPQDPGLLVPASAALESRLVLFAARSRACSQTAKASSTDGSIAKGNNWKRWERWASMDPLAMHRGGRYVCYADGVGKQMADKSRVDVSWLRQVFEKRVLRNGPLGPWASRAMSNKSGNEEGPPWCQRAS